MLTAIIDLFQSIIGAFASGKTVDQYNKDKQHDQTNKKITVRFNEKANSVNRLPVRTIGGDEKEKICL